MIYSGSIEMPEGYFMQDAVRDAIAAAYWGEFERAIAAITSFLAQDPPEDQAIFALRETIAWRAEIGDLDRAAKDAAACAKRGCEHWGTLDLRALMVRNTEMYWAGKAGKQKESERLAKSLLIDADTVLDEREPLRTAIRNNAARILELGEHADMAEQIYVELLEDFDKWQEADGIEALTTRANYIDYLESIGELSKAREVSSRQVILLLQSHGAKSPMTLYARYRMAILVLCDGDTETGTELMEAVAGDCEKYLEPGDELSVSAIEMVIALAMQADLPNETVSGLDRLIEQLKDITEPGGQLMTGIKQIRNRYREQCAAA